jgi:hypothetical protein
MPPIPCRPVVRVRLDDTGIVANENAILSVAFLAALREVETPGEGCRIVKNHGLVVSNRGLGIKERAQVASPHFASRRPFPRHQTEALGFLNCWRGSSSTRGHLSAISSAARFSFGAALNITSRARSPAVLSVSLQSPGSLANNHVRAADAHAIVGSVGCLHR